MKRYILIFTGGKMQQQDGINQTFAYLVEHGMLVIIDTVEGRIKKVDGWEPIMEYNSPDLIIE